MDTQALHFMYRVGRKCLYMVNTDMSIGSMAMQGINFGGKRLSDDISSTFD